MAYTLYTAFEYDSSIQTAVEIIAACGKIYVTSAIVFFCLISWVIADQFQTIGDQVNKLSKTTAVNNLSEYFNLLSILFEILYRLHP